MVQARRLNVTSLGASYKIIATPKIVKSTTLLFLATPINSNEFTDFELKSKHFDLKK